MISQMRQGHLPRICMIAGVEYEHEDDHNYYTSFTAEELDGLEEYG